MSVPAKDLFYDWLNDMHRAVVNSPGLRHVLVDPERNPPSLLARWAMEDLPALRSVRAATLRRYVHLWREEEL